ncbi:hypothetical protein Tco_0896115 [Tanacetum coccineum]
MSDGGSRWSIAVDCRWPPLTGGFSGGSDDGMESIIGLAEDASRSALRGTQRWGAKRNKQDHGRAAAAKPQNLVSPRKRIPEQYS